METQQKQKNIFGSLGLFFSILAIAVPLAVTLLHLFVFHKDPLESVIYGIMFWIFGVIFSIIGMFKKNKKHAKAGLIISVSIAVLSFITFFIFAVLIGTSGDFFAGNPHTH